MSAESLTRECQCVVRDCHNSGNGFDWGRCFRPTRSKLCSGCAARLEWRQMHTEKP